MCIRDSDIDTPVMEELVKEAAASSSYQVLGHHVEFSGICPSCQKEARRKQLQ